MAFALPLLAIPVRAAAPWIWRSFGRYVGGPLLTGIGTLFKSRAGLFIFAAFAWLGINFGTLKLIVEPAIDILRGLTMDLGSGAASGDIAVAASQYLGVMQFDRAITMLVSAIVVKHGLMRGRIFLYKRGI